MQYIDPVFRPPSEAKSLILQITNGCSWNRCSFCEMYTAPQKKFRPKPEAQLIEELKFLHQAGYQFPRVFLADGDAMALSFRRLKAVLEALQQYLPDTRRVSSYCLPRNLKNKSVEELKELQELGLSILYVGCETGDNALLQTIDKGEDAESSLEALQKIKQAHLKSSVMIINGLGGRQFSKQHAVNSAKLMTEAQPDYLSTLVLSFPDGPKRHQKHFNGSFEPLSQQELFEELAMFVSHLELSRTTFRSDHASNYLVLKGTLNTDKEHILRKLQAAIDTPETSHLRKEWQRGL
ncbi:MAG: radical SAM protein [SAR324 cluster bacterium]|nr:radical SAM protein [SAR324 cluster bacterium]